MIRLITARQRVPNFHPPARAIPRDIEAAHCARYILKRKQINGRLTARASAYICMYIETGMKIPRALCAAGRETIS